MGNPKKLPPDWSSVKHGSGASDSHTIYRNRRSGNEKDEIKEPFLWLLEHLLFIFAAINFLLLFSYNRLIQIEDFYEISIVYTLMTAMILSLIYLFKIFQNRLSIGILRRKLPDLILVVLSVIFFKEPVVFQLCLLGRQTYLLAFAISKRREVTQRILNPNHNPALFVLITFLITILIGAVLLLLPMSTAAGSKTSFTGAILTATSATCVTGMMVYDTGTHFSTFGQVIIMLLFQIGGIGIMTISTSFAILTGHKLSLRGETIMQNVVEQTNRIDMLKLVKNIVIVTLLFEIIGAILLYGVISLKHQSVSYSLYSSFFHSVSSFCNAGFSLYSDSLTAFRGSWFLNLTVMLLVILGGIGFFVLVDLKRNLIEKYRPERFSLHTKIVLSTSLFLIIFGFLLFFITEYNHSMQGFSLKERLLGSIFQSVSVRTAGFNTIDISQFSNSSIFISLFLMFIGASPGSTGGGIKTTSFAIIFLSVVTILLGNEDVIVFKRKISDSLIRRVMVLIAVSSALLFIIIILLMMIEPFSFSQIVFEAFCAFSTTGMTLGITPYLSGTSRILISILMFFGRVGPLTLIYALSRTKMKGGFAYEEERIPVG